MSSSELHRPFMKYLALRDFAAPRSTSICSLEFFQTRPSVEKQFREGRPPGDPPRAPWGQLVRPQKRPPGPETDSPLTGTPNTVQGKQFQKNAKKRGF